MKQPLAIIIHININSKISDLNLFKLNECLQEPLAGLEIEKL